MDQQLTNQICMFDTTSKWRSILSLILILSLYTWRSILSLSTIVLPFLLPQDGKVEKHLPSPYRTKSSTKHVMCESNIQSYLYKHTLFSHNMQSYQLVARLQEVCPTSEGSCRAEKYKPGRLASQYEDTRWSTSHCLAVLH